MDECENCDGTGNCPDCGEVFNDDCVECGGSGVCNDCGGSGDK